MNPAEKKSFVVVSVFVNVFLVVCNGAFNGMCCS